MCPDPILPNPHHLKLGGQGGVASTPPDHQILDFFSRGYGSDIGPKRLIMVYCNALSAFLVPIAGYGPLSTKNTQILVVRGGVDPVGGRPPPDHHFCNM